MNPILAWALGMLFSEAMQWGLWIVGHPGKSPKGYFDDGVAHFLLAWSVCGSVCTLWALGGLDLLMSLLPDGVLGAWWKAGVPYTPQVGLLLAFGLDFTADKIAFAVRARLAPAPATPGGTAP